MRDAVLEAETHTGCVEEAVMPWGFDEAYRSWRDAQADWAAAPVGWRLRVLKSARHGIARQAEAFAAAISSELARTSADTMVAEVLPLLEACRFLEREAENILEVSRLGRRGLPFWLAGVRSEVQRVALGKVLVIGPANYPLFLPGVQTLQGLVAGNAVVWKPGRGGKAVADLFAKALYAAGLPVALLRVTDESVAAGDAELGVGADKVFFTGSAVTGRAVMKRLAATATPCVMELSGCDAVVVLPSADLGRVVAALAFGMRLNGSATCMAPRRVFLVEATVERRERLIGMLLTQLDWVGGVRLAEPVCTEFHRLVAGAAAMGAVIHGELDEAQQPILVTNATQQMEIAKSDLFAPVLMVMDSSSEAEALAAIATCPYGLTAAVFGAEGEARVLAGKMAVGTVLVNDLIVPTADPRVPFGGRRGSGFGVTRGAEGLLEMTAVKVVSVRRGRSVRHFEATTARHAGLFGGLIAASHAGSWMERLRGVKRLVTAARRLKDK